MADSRAGFSPAERVPLHLCKHGGRASLIGKGGPFLQAEGVQRLALLAPTWTLLGRVTPALTLLMGLAESHSGCTVLQTTSPVHNPASSLPHPQVLISRALLFSSLRMFASESASSSQSLAPAVVKERRC